MAGGVGIYIKNGIDYDIINSLSLCEPTIAESIFIEVRNKKKKNIIVGCVYRHPSTELKTFNESFLTTLMIGLSKMNKPCFISGDGNADLLKMESHNETSLFFETLISFANKPTILQPTRVTLSSASLIDKIFVNNPGISSIGGNITSTISDHFPQFAIFDSFPNEQTKQRKIKGRSFKNFNQNEFARELKVIDWVSLFHNKNGHQCCELFFKSITQLLDEMAPI